MRQHGIVVPLHLHANAAGVVDQVVADRQALDACVAVHAVLDQRVLDDVAIDHNVRGLLADDDALSSVLDRVAANGDTVAKDRDAGAIAVARCGRSQHRNARPSDEVVNELDVRTRKRHHQRGVAEPGERVVADG